jgi:Peptidase family M28
MKPVRLAIGRAARSAARRPDLAAPGVSSLKFGDDIVYCGSGKPWSEFTNRARGAGTDLREHPGEVARERLHVVVQKGRLFQREHPETPVLIDKGRFLLVDLEPERARKIGNSDLPCFSVQPLDTLKTTRARGRHRVIYDALPRVEARGAADPVIQGLVNRISRQTYEADLTRLVQFNTRNSTRPEFAAACDFVDQRLASLGYTTKRQKIQVNGSPSQNVIAVRAGSGSASRGVVLLSAHLDSINHEGAATSPAPGADDDGSGSAGVIEIARALNGHQGKHDLKLVLFGGEEQGLFGSKKFVASMTPAARAKVRAVVHMDMIASLNSASPTVLLEGAALSRSIIDGLSAAASTYTGLTVQTSLNPFNSDHVPFIRKGVPAVLTIEGTDDANHAIHSARDTLDRLNFDLALEILRMNTAFVAEALVRT